MRILIPGGSGQIGSILARHLSASGHEVTVLSRNPTRSAQPWRSVFWDAPTEGPWLHELQRADVVVNLCGRSVNCRYTRENRREIFDSRSFRHTFERADPGGYP